MQIPLENIDQLRERAGIGYSEARNILEEVDGDLVEALIYIEERRGEARNRVSSWSRDISQQLRQFAAGLHRTRLRVKVKDNTWWSCWPTAPWGALSRLPPRLIRCSSAQDPLR